MQIDPKMVELFWIWQLIASWQRGMNKNGAGNGKFQKYFVNVL